MNTTEAEKTSKIASTRAACAHAASTATASARMNTRRNGSRPCRAKVPEVRPAKAYAMV